MVTRTSQLQFHHLEITPYLNFKDNIVYWEINPYPKKSSALASQPVGDLQRWNVLPWGCIWACFQLRHPTRGTGQSGAGTGYRSNFRECDDWRSICSFQRLETRGQLTGRTQPRRNLETVPCLRGMLFRAGQYTHCGGRQRCPVGGLWAPHEDPLRPQSLPVFPLADWSESGPGANCNHESCSF